MADKKFNFDGRDLIITDPANINFASPYFETVYVYFFDKLIPGNYEPQFDVDHIHSRKIPLDLKTIAEQNNEIIDSPSKKATNKERAQTQLLLRSFITNHPEFFGFFSNTISSAFIAIANAEFLINKKCDGSNFIKLKEVIDVVNHSSWTRDKDTTERQSGVSVLGTISETLLKHVLEEKIDNTNFFQTNNPNIQSYGDFVAMCLPNNLWISVKSNFARERLLASGYSNDIIGVGFFEDYKEFTNPVRIRNFQRAGFLAMYCPDVAVKPEQRQRNTSTYHQIKNFYNKQNLLPPLNINGKPFIRKLSDLSSDLDSLLNIADIKSRFTVGF